MLSWTSVIAILSLEKHNPPVRGRRVPTKDLGSVGTECLLSHNDAFKPFSVEHKAAGKARRTVHRTQRRNHNAQQTATDRYRVEEEEKKKERERRGRWDGGARSQHTEREERQSARAHEQPRHTNQDERRTVMVRD